MNNASFSLEQKILQIRLIAFDFDGVFTDNMVYVSQDGMETVKCSRSDGIGLRKLENIGIKPIIISTETNPVVSVRCKKLKIRCIQGCENKHLVLTSIAEEMGLLFEQIAFVGNDINDLSCLTDVGLPIVVRNAHPDVILHSLYQTTANGGDGAVREICDLFVRIFQKTGREGVE